MKTKTFEKLPETKQTAILDASARVFAQKGYFQTGINEICQSCEISNGALYKYFENKQGLFIAVAQRSIDLLQRAADQIATEQLDFWKKIQRILEEVVPFITLCKDYFTVYMELGHPMMDAFAAELTDDYERQSFEFFDKLVREAQEKGDVREGVASETAAYFLDNHLMLLAFSFVSEHYNRRFHQFFAKENEQLEADQKIELIMRSYWQLLA